MEQCSAAQPSGGAVDSAALFAVRQFRQSHPEFDAPGTLRIGVQMRTREVFSDFGARCAVAPATAGYTVCR